MALILAAGCSPLASPDEKAASMRDYAFSPVEGRPLQRHAALRSAMLIRGARPVAIDESRYPRSFAFEAAMHKSVAIGTAVCLTSDGYYLTAAHNLQSEQEFYLAVRSDLDARLRVVPGSVIWCGDEEDDLALVWANLSDLDAFTWAPLEQIQPGMAVLSWGLEPSAGQVRKPPQGVEAGENTFSRHVVVHTAPLREGDSGGPLVDASGRLVGINIGRSWDFLTGQSTALRPDPERLRRDIQAHRALRAANHPSLTPPSSGL
jgi:S1-C subfamily serine protease